MLPFYHASLFPAAIFLCELPPLLLMPPNLPACSLPHCFYASFLFRFLCILICQLVPCRAIFMQASSFAFYASLLVRLVLCYTVSMEASILPVLTLCVCFL